MRSDRLGRRRVESSCSRLLPCATNSASSLVRMGAFAQLTGCFGCFWRGFGPGGGKRWCSSSHPLSIVGIAKAYVAAGAAARDVREDHASIHSVAI
jgi:hypothetical protein